MRLSFSLGQAVLLAGVVFASSVAAEDAKRHTWSRIEYRSLPCPWASGTVHPVLRVPSKDEAQGLHFRLTFSRSYVSGQKQDFVAPEPSKIKVRLHLPNGKIAEPKKSEFDNLMLWAGNGRRASATLQRVFPWTANQLDEAWIELRYPGHVFWLEMPYGFTRNPSDVLCQPSDSAAPKFAPTMKTLDKNAKIVNWEHVAYDLGTIQNGWRLRLMHSNPFDARSEIVLYRDDSKIGKSMFLWDLHSPRTSAKIHQSDKVVLESLAMSIRLHEDGLRRSDTFKFNRNPGSDELRDWGRIVITIDDKSHETVLPSSLFRYVHGVADPYHRRTLR